MPVMRANLMIRGIWTPPLEIERALRRVVCDGMVRRFRFQRSRRIQIFGAGARCAADGGCTALRTNTCAELLRTAESARGISPRAAHRTGRKPLDLSGSCHSLKAAALRHNQSVPPVAGCPKSIMTRMARPLRSTGITPLLRYYGAVRPCPAHRYFWPRGSPTCAFSLTIAGQVLKFRTKARMRVTPPVHRTPHGQ